MSKAPDPVPNMIEWDDHAIELVQRVVPLANLLNQRLSKLVSVALLGLLWLIAYFAFIRQWPTTLVVVSTLLTLLLFVLPWRVNIALKSLTELPKELRDVSDQAELALHSVKQTSQENHGTQKGDLFELKSLLGEAGDLLAQYASIGVLLNPLSLLLCMLSCLGLMGVIAGAILVFGVYLF